jgi:hypothetical protein
MRIAKKNLKKQSQFVPAGIDVKSYIRSDYDKKPESKARKNKANSKPNLNLSQRTPGSQSKRNLFNKEIQSAYYFSAVLANSAVNEKTKPIFERAK